MYVCMYAMYEDGSAYHWTLFAFCQHLQTRTGRRQPPIRVNEPARVGPHEESQIREWWRRPAR